MTGTDGAGMERLRDALDAFLAAGDGIDPEALLRDRPEVADLLSSMLAGEQAREPDARRPIGDFELLREIGRGGMGVVYEARQLSLQRSVALKVLTPGAGLEPAAILRFRREAAAAAALEHEGIVKVHATGVSGDVHWIAMELVDGAPLNRAGAALRQRGVAAVVDVVAQVAEALAHAHAKGIVHRDVKPANVLLRANGRAMLTDFGIARDARNPSLTATQGFAGTPYYAAPEQLRGGAAADARSDVFSLGTTLYELLTGRLPFAGATTHEVTQSILGREATDPQRLDAALPDDLCAIVLKALEKAPERRYQSAAEFAADLRAFLAHKSVQARRPTRIERLRRWVRREPLRATLAGVLLVGGPLLVGSLGYLLANLDHIRTGELALRARQLDDALAEATILQEASRFRDAAATLTQILADDPGNEEAIGGLVFCHWHTASRKTATTHLDQALKALDAHAPIVAKSTPLLRLRAEILEVLDRKPEAEQIRAGLGPVTGALDHFLMGRAQLARGHRGERAAFSRAVEYLRRALIASDKQRVTFAFEYAHAAGHVTDRSVAADCEALLSERWADRGLAWFWAGFAHQGVDIGKAIACYQKAVALDPTLFLAWDNLGAALANRGEFVAARQAFERGIAAKPKAAGLRRNFGIALINQGEFDLAEQEFRKVLELDADDVASLVQIAALQRRKRDHDAAEKSLRSALTFDPDHARALGALGELLVDRGKHDEAVPLLQRSIELDPEEILAPFHLGRALTAKNDLSGAKAAYETATLRSPTHAQAWTNLGHVKRKLGDLAGAIAVTEKALELRPTLLEPNRNYTIMLREAGRADDLRVHVKAWAQRMPESAEALLEHARTHVLDLPPDTAPDPKAARALVQEALRQGAAARPNLLRVASQLLAIAGDHAGAIEALQLLRPQLAAQGMSQQQLKNDVDVLIARYRRQLAASRPTSGPESRGR